jgi:hypothetical protein
MNRTVGSWLPLSHRVDRDQVHRYGATHRVAALACWLLLIPILASAQELAGTVRDASGGVLPGVTVEAASPALIERVRTTVTDGTGQYRITELRPGTYTVTFSLPGFATVQREGVSLSGQAIVNINAELRVGGLEETITVTGETPVVDVQSTRRQAVLSSEIVNTIPASRGYGNLLMAVPSVNVNLLNSGTDPTMQFFTSLGGRSNEGRVQIAGMNVGSAFNGGGVSSFAYDTSNAEEVQVTVSGGLGEADIGGPALNIIPREGGNRFSGTAFFSNAGEWSQGSNIDDRLRSFGINDPPALIRSWDASFSMGGPIVRDRLWFFGTARSFGNSTQNAGLYANLNAGNPDSWWYAPDLGLPSRTANDKKIGAGRLTGQLTPRNKLGFYYDYQHNCGGSTLTLDADGCRKRGSDWVALGNFFGITSPESGTMWDDREIVSQVTWSSPVTNRLLLEAGYSTFISRWGGQDPGGALTSFIPVTEQVVNANTQVPFANFTYRGLDARFGNEQQPQVWRASASYVTGAHSLKFGTQGAYHMHKNFNFTGTNQLRYQFNNGMPNQFSMWMPLAQSNRTTFHAFYVQDQWTLDRLTVQGALRFERAWSWHPAGENGVLEANRFSDMIVFPRLESVRGYNDLSPRVGVAYDVFGTGRTAVKMQIGHYLQSANNEGNFIINNPATTFQRNTNRSWVDRNGNFTPDCDLMNPAGQNLATQAGFNPALDTCGPWSNLNFGNQFNTTQVNPDVLAGWGVRPYDWQLTASVQQEIAPRVSVQVAYNRRWFGNFFYTDNLAVGPGDYDTVTVTAPSHPGLPNGGGYPVTFVTIKDSAFGQQQNYYTFASDYGKDTRYWHGLDVNVNARTTWGLVLQAGTITGRGVRNNCEITAQLPEVLGTGQVSSCDVAEKWLTSLRGLATYRVPTLDVLISGIFRSQAANTPVNAVATNGASLAANYLVSTAMVQQAIGRPLAGGVANQTVNLIHPGQLYADRLNSIDLRFAKVVRFAGKRADIGVDLHNLTNGNTGTAYNQNFGSDGSAWLRPTAILNPRFVRFNVTFNF